MHVNALVPTTLPCWPGAQVLAVEQRRADEAAAKKQEVAELQALWSRMAEEQVRCWLLAAGWL